MVMVILIILNGGDNDTDNNGGDNDGDDNGGDNNDGDNEGDDDIRVMFDDNYKDVNN